MRVPTAMALPAAARRRRSSHRPGSRQRLT